jgi:putative acetyltransferase
MSGTDFYPYLHNEALLRDITTIIIKIVESLPDSAEGCHLMDALSTRLTVITGDDGRSHFKPDALLQGACFLLAMYGSVAVGCGALRPVNLPGTLQVGEIKRMYACEPGLGIGSALLAALEQRARDFGYLALRLETRKINQLAVDFYLRHGYHVRENYGPYIGRIEAICFEKYL